MTTNDMWKLGRELDALRDHRQRINDELRDVNDRLESKTGKADGLKERGRNLAAALLKIDELIDAKDAAYRNAILDSYNSGSGGVGVEAGTPFGDSAPTGRAGIKALGSNPLDVSPDHLAGVQEWIDGARRGDLEVKSTVLTSDLGARRSWGTNSLDGPRLLHVVGGASEQVSESVFAQHPSLTLPTATAGVGEGVSLAEYDNVTPGSVTLQRFGRFTDLSGESLLSAAAAPIMQVHTIGIGKDLDASLQAKLETDAGTPDAFNADVPAAVRRQIAVVADNTAAAPENLVIVCHPDDIHLLEDVTPIGGRTIGESFTRFSGAIVYPTSAQNAGTMLIANLRVGVIWFRAQNLTSEMDRNVKTNVTTIATSIIGGYGTNLITGYVKAQDVATP